MKLSQLKTCECCGKEVAPIIHEVSVKRHLILPNEVNKVLGVNQILGGNALRIAEALTANDVTKQIDDVCMFVCQRCFVNYPVAYLCEIKAKNEQS